MESHINKSITKRPKRSDYNDTSIYVEDVNKFIDALESENAELRVKSEGAERLANKYQFERDKLVEGMERVNKAYHELQQEKAELRERINRTLEAVNDNERMSDFAVATDTVRALLTDAPLATPRTDADGLRVIGEKLIGYTEHEHYCQTTKTGNIRLCNCLLTELINQFRSKEGGQNG